MIKIFNVLFTIFRLILIVAATCLTAYIIMGMYDRLGKDLTEAINVFIPFVLLFFLFLLNLALGQRGVTMNIFYNITCTVALGVIVLMGLRSMYDTNLIYNGKLGYGINFVYFSDCIQFIKILLYGLCIANVFLMFRIKPKKIVKQTEVEGV